jgi:hypothetical protein
MEVNEIDRNNINLERGAGETVESYYDRLAEFLSRIRWQSEGHRQWYTHKNPYGCWICELLQIGELYRDLAMDQRDNSELEEYNVDEEPIND